ncbi:hypothetical protein FS749_000786 [Ceratobasidium sp. UAMH 11750]|nr:hypothetical protein FS749_000786 [Ceratobasidium sp. UAMH 11750]
MCLTHESFTAVRHFYPHLLALLDLWCPLKSLLFALVSTGPQDLHAPGGFWDQVVIPGTRGKRDVKGSDLLTNAREDNEERLLCLNRLMTKRRIDARHAPPSPFHTMLAKFLESGKLLKCLTKNVDGLETVGSPKLAERVTMLHGDNRVLTCLEVGCPDICAADVIKFDGAFLNDEPVPCPSCEEKREMRRRSNKRVAKDRPHNLRPAVRWDGSLDPDFLIEELYTSFPEEIKGCDTLLIIGTPPTGLAYTSIVPEIARRVHELEGVVVFIDPSPLPENEFKDRVDYHLQMDIQLCCKVILEVLQHKSGEKAQESATDIWAELSEPLLLAASHLDSLPALDFPVCCQCALDLADVLAPCSTCHAYFCFEIAGTQTGRMCVVLDYFTTETSSANYHERLRAFQCFECYDHSSGMYPHFIRRVPMFRPHPVQIPRLLLLVYYLGQFWPMAEHIINNITSHWKALGWAYRCVPMRLQSLTSCTDILDICNWESKSYKALVVYVTHGSAGQKRYQLSDTLELSPAQFLDETLRPVSKALKNAAFAAGFLLTCGHVYDAVNNVLGIENWLKT